MFEISICGQFVVVVTVYCQVFIHTQGATTSLTPNIKYKVG